MQRARAGTSPPTHGPSIVNPTGVIRPFGSYAHAGPGSGRLPGPLQKQKDSLMAAIKRLEDGLLPGESLPPPPKSKEQLAAGVRQNAQYHAAAQPPPSGRPSIGGGNVSSAQGASSESSASSARGASSASGASARPDDGTTRAPDRDTGDTSPELMKANYYKVCFAELTLSAH